MNNEMDRATFEHLSEMARRVYNKRHFRHEGDTAEEDFVQVAVLKVWNVRDQWPDDPSYRRAWLYKTMRHAMYNLSGTTVWDKGRPVDPVAAKKATRSPRTKTMIPWPTELRPGRISNIGSPIHEDDLDSVYHGAAIVSSEGDIIDHGFEAVVIQDWFGSIELTERQKVIVGYTLQGLNPSEVSRELGVRPMTIYQALDAVRKKLLKALPNWMDEDRPEKSNQFLGLTPAEGVAQGWLKENRNNGLCHCGCGEQTQPARATSRATGRLRGYPVRFVNGHHMRPEVV